MTKEKEVISNMIDQLWPKTIKDSDRQDFINFDKLDLQDIIDYVNGTTVEYGHYLRCHNHLISESTLRIETIHQIDSEISSINSNFISCYHRSPTIAEVIEGLRLIFCE